MLLRENFTEEYIRKLQNSSKKDPALLERTVYAFGLLEALARTEMPFIFKGGTSLMLLLEHPHRLSTDIDIVVAPGTDVDSYIAKASEVFPFAGFDEQFRVGRNKIVKRHFKFTYESPVNGRAFYILLDVVFEENNYETLVSLEIRNELLLTSPEYLRVYVPSVDCILGDKLAAFAPHTTGIPLNEGKDMEVMKQMYDICSLLEVFSDFETVSDTYRKIAGAEIEYRGNGISIRDAMTDTYYAALCLASRGRINQEDYPHYVRGIRDLRTHIYAGNYSPETAAVQAAKITYLIACMINNEGFETVSDYTTYLEKRFTRPDMAPLKYLRKVSPEAYAYAIKADELMGQEIT